MSAVALAPDAPLLLAAIELAALAGLAAAAVKEHAAAGVELRLLTLGLLLAPLHLRRLLCLAGKTAAPAWPLVLLEAVAVASAFVGYPIGDPPLVAAALLGATLALTDDRPANGAAAPLLRALAWIALALAVGATALDLARDPVHGARIGALLAPLLLEALAPGRNASPLANVRRAAAAATVAGAVVFAGSDASWAVWAVLGAHASAALLWLAVLRHAPERRSWARRRTLLRIFAPVVALALLWTVGEVAFRVVPNRYRELVPVESQPWHEPGKTMVYTGALLSPRQPFTNEVRWNQGGWHDVDHAREKPAGKARFLVLGDSYVEGVQVPRDNLYHRRVERELEARGVGPAEGIGIGWAGWGQGEELDALGTHGLDYRPDLVLLEFLPSNDVRNNDDELEALARAETWDGTFARRAFVQALGARLFFSACVTDRLDLVLRALQGRKDAIDLDVYRERPRARSDLWARSWKHTEDLLGSMRALAASRGAELAVVVFTSELSIGIPIAGAPEDLDPSLPERRIREICARREIPCLDLAPRFALVPLEERRTLHLRDDGHWSTHGHERAALETVKFLVDETPLWQRARTRAGLAPR